MEIVDGLRLGGNRSVMIGDRPMLGHKYAGLTDNGVYPRALDGHSCGDMYMPNEDRIALALQELALAGCEMTTIYNLDGTYTHMIVQKASDK